MTRVTDRITNHYTALTYSQLTNFRQLARPKPPRSTKPRPVPAEHTQPQEQRRRRLKQRFQARPLQQVHQAQLQTHTGAQLLTMRPFGLAPHKR